VLFRGRWGGWVDYLIQYLSICFLTRFFLAEKALLFGVLPCATMHSADSTQQKTGQDCFQNTNFLRGGCS